MDTDYLNPENQFALSKTFEGWSPGTRIDYVLEVLDPEGDNSRERALVKIKGIQVVIPLSYLVKLKPRTVDPGPPNSKRKNKAAIRKVEEYSDR